MLSVCTGHGLTCPDRCGWDPFMFVSSRVLAYVLARTAQKTTENKYVKFFSALLFFIRKSGQINPVNMSRSMEFSTRRGDSRMSRYKAGAPIWVFVTNMCDFSQT